MTEGTKSYLFGCHHFFFHPLWVLMAWRLEDRLWPKWWEIICIFLHDIGICGREYLSDNTAKDGHWTLGAWWSYKIVRKLSRNPWLGYAAAWMCAGHCPEESSFLPYLQIQKSKLFHADKRSWLVAPMWWLQWNHWAEGFEKHGIVSPHEWREMVRKNLMQENPCGSHQLDLRFRAKNADVCNGKKGGDTGRDRFDEDRKKRI